MKVIYKTVPLIQYNFKNFFGFKLRWSKQRSDDLYQFDKEAMDKLEELVKQKKSKKYIMKFRMKVANVYGQLSYIFKLHGTIGDIIDFTKSKI